MSAIAVTDPLLVFSPYTWDVTAERAMSINAGAYVRAAFEGKPTDLVATFDLFGLGTPKAVVEIRVNGGDWTRQRLTASVPVPVPAGPAWPVTMVEVVLDAIGGGSQVWTTQNRAAKFTGFSSASTLTLREWRKPDLRVLAVADSLGQGVFTLGPSVGQTETFPFVANSARLGWAFPLRELLNCQLGVRGFGGVGLTRAGDDSVPKFLTIWDKLYDGRSADLTGLDLIVFSPGTNDSAATASAVTEETRLVLNDMLTKTSARIALVRNWKGVQAAAIAAAIPLCSSPGRVTWIDSAGWWQASEASDGTHPYGWSNLLNLTPRIASAVAKDVLGSTSLWFDGTTWVR